jgi:zinc/manganese transport system permease protein
MNAYGLDAAILLPALFVGLLVCATHVPLGLQVLARGIVFIDLALAQIAALGPIIAGRLGYATDGWMGQVFAVGAALCGALLLTFTERRWPRTQEPLIGALFVLAASGAVLLVAHDPHGGEALRGLLEGQILWVDPGQLPLLAALTLGLLVLWGVFMRRAARAGFYLVFACAVTLSVQVVGVYLVFATLILPALAVQAVVGRARLVAGYLTASLGYLAGLAVSALMDLPASACIAWSLAVSSLICARITRGPRMA